MALVRSAQEVSSSSNTRRRRPPFSYDVFLSFRGEDTRKTFTDHLYTAFLKAGFRTFRDDDELERGEDIKPEFRKAIQQSRSSVVVFSKDYASSGWCLDELVMILQRKRTSGDHVVLPVFYDVDPSHLRKQTGRVAKAFARHDRNQLVKHKIKGWREALTEVADLAGMVLQNQTDGHESKFIEKIVKVIEDKISRTPLSVAPHLIGMHSRVKNITLWLQDGSSDLGILVIYGMRGIGKTTMAQFVYNSHFKRFQRSSFIENIRERSRTRTDLIQMQKQVIYDVLNGRKVKIHTVSEGIMKIEDAISSKRVLLVFDDVDHEDQLNAVFRMQGQFHPGSKVIITTSKAGLLKDCHQLTKVHVKTFGDSESLELFNWHAFGQNHPNEDYMEYSKKVVQLCGGLPLALKVLGSSLSGQSIFVWKSALNKLKAIPNGEIMNKLRLSYDSLQDDHDQKLFLHIACFFIGRDKDVIVRILDGCGFYTVIGIENLIERCLVTIDEHNKVHIHHMIRDMGREIVRLESTEPEERSRLWHHNDSFKVLTKKNGTQTIEGLILNMEMHPSNEEVLESNAFAKMHKLRLLKLRHVHVNGSYEEFPKDLRWLCWDEFPFDYLPNDFPLESLVALEMCFSSLKQVWKETRYLPSLKILNLSHSHDLIETPDFLHISNLEILILKDCANLVNVKESIGSLERLVHLNMEDCKKIRKLPKNICMFRFLETFIISGCSNLNEFPTMEKWKMESLKILQADGIPIHRLFTTTGEVKLGPSKNPEIVWASYLPHSLVDLSLANCNLFDDDFPKDFRNLSRLQRLNLHSNPISCLPDCIRGLTRLDYLSFGRCKGLKSLVRMPKVEKLYVDGCTLLETITGQSSEFTGLDFNYNLVEIGWSFKLEPIKRVEKEMTQLFGSINLQPTDTIMMDTFSKFYGKRRMLPIQVLYEPGVISTFVPGSEVPSQFSHKTRGSSISFTVPSLSHQKIQGLNIFSVYAQCNIDCPSTINDEFESDFPNQIITRVSNKRLKSQGLKWIYGPRFHGVPGDGQDIIWLSHWKIGNQLEVGDEVTVSVFTRSELQVKECGIKLVYEQEDTMVTTQHNNDDTTISPLHAYGIGGDFSYSEVLPGIYFLCDGYESMEYLPWLPRQDWFKYIIRDSDEITEEGQQDDGTIETRTDEKTVEAWTKALNAKTKTSLAKIEHKKNKELVSSPLRELGSIEDCMEVLEAMEGVDDDAYFRACENFTNSNWCRMFMMMSDVRKRVWLNVDQHKKNKEVSSPLRELGSIEDCMDVLEAMEGADDAAYFRACEKFTNSDWRRMFMKMSNARKIAWLKSLK